MTKSRLAATGLLALAFALGALAGGAATMLADRQSHRAHSWRGGREEFVQRLEEELNLTPTQSAQITDIVRRHEPAMDSILAPVRPQFTAERLAVRGEIKALLSADQARRYDIMIARRDSLHAREAGKDAR